jgi:uncharacterized membrane protein
MKWIWKNGIVATFMAGLFTLLPILLTIIIVVWLSGYVVSFLGPDTWVGNSFKYVGLKFVANELVAYTIGIAVVLVGIWSFGVLVRTKAKSLVVRLMEVPKRIPLINSVYGTVQQIVKMFKKEEGEDFEGMEVVYCFFGHDGGGFLALSPPGTFKFDVDVAPKDKIVRPIYIPTSPVPMTGGFLFWSTKHVCVIPHMTVDSVMQVYLSLGVLAPQAIPQTYHHNVPNLSMFQQGETPCSE